MAKIPLGKAAVQFSIEGDTKKLANVALQNRGSKTRREGLEDFLSQLLKTQVKLHGRVGLDLRMVAVLDKEAADKLQQPKPKMANSLTPGP